VSRHADLFAWAALPAEPEPPWIAPAPDPRCLDLMLRDGGLSFEEGDPIDDQLQGMADETMIGLQWEMNAIRGLDAARRAGRRAFKTERRWQEFLQGYPAARARHARDFVGTLDAIETLWGPGGRQAFAREAKRRECG
jgi:hypothetical protein